MSINSNEIIKKPDVIIDPNFLLPPGVVDARYPNEEEVDQNEIDQATFDGDGIQTPDIEFLEPVEETEDNDPTILYPPDSLVVVSQTVRMGENGQQVVDVVLEILDVDASIQIDVRMSKEQ
jgi:hypothetical protein